MRWHFERVTDKGVVSRFNGDLFLVYATGKKEIYFERIQYTVDP